MGKLNENIQLLTFRNKASFGIRKDLRKKAYTMAIDVVIKSVDYNLYENSKANPSIQFYGYCVLVFQDMTSLEIPIHFPRQRLYYAIQGEAFRQWRGFVNYYEQYLLHRQNAITLGLILAAFEIPPVEIDSELARTQWIELPLREVYIKCQKNTQFQIEYTAWEPVEFIDPISGLPNNGESNQEDGDKDGGLPKDGIQPARNSPSNPFGNNPPPSSIQELGQKGFDTLDESKLGDVDPDNFEVTITPDPAGTIYWLKIVATERRSSFPSGCSVPRITTSYYQLIDDTVRATLVPRNDFEFQNPCGGVVTRSDLFLTGGTSALFFLNVEGGSPSLDYGRGLTLPADTVTFG